MKTFYLKIINFITDIGVIMGVRVIVILIDNSIHLNFKH